MRVQTKSNIVIIGFLIGGITIPALLSKHISSEAIVAVTFGWLFLTFIVHLIFIRCPHCDECVLDRSGVGRVCRHCGTPPNTHGLVRSACVERLSCPWLSVSLVVRNNAMLGFGWCHLQTSREKLRNARLDEVDRIEAEIDRADLEMFTAFREWIGRQNDPFLVWTLLEQHNNHCGLLTYSLSRNHRTSAVWDMLEWIAVNAPGSYGLFYCHDDEDTMSRDAYGRSPAMDYDNVFRVHRIKNGRLEELADPFFGLIEGDLAPVHPYNRASQHAPNREPDTPPNSLGLGSLP